MARARAAGAREPDEYGFDGGLTPQRVMAVLDELVDEDTVTVADASYASVWTTYYLTAKKAGQRFLTPRGLAGLGWGLPMALGAQAALGTRRVVCVAGDGGFGHVWAELETAVREQLPVTVVLLHNGTLGFQRHAELVAFDAYTSACDFSPVDHTKVAEAVGARAVTVSDSDELKPVLADALAHRGPVLVEVMTSPHAHPPITGWEKRLSVLADNQAI